MNPLLLVFIIPASAGILGFVIYRLRNEFNFLGTILTLYYSLYLFITTRKPVIHEFNLFQLGNIKFSFFLDQFSGIVLLGIAVVSFVIVLYSFRYMRGLKHFGVYYFYLLLSIAAANGMILANNLLLFLFFSIVLSILFYVLLTVSSEESTSTKNQSFLSLILFNVLISLGISILIFRTGNASIISDPKLIPYNSSLVYAYLLILIGIIGKIGIIPFQWWTLKLTKSTPITIYTLIPMIFEKIIGVYLLIRLSYYIFDISGTSLVRFIILAVGSISIIIACLMAIRTKDSYHLLNFASITQIGFIFIGIGCANPLGYASAVLNSINYLAFQPVLFLTAGSVEYWTKTTNLDSFQGIASKLPITFFACLFAVLALCGVPPLNGFFSKWIMFDAIIKINPNGLNITSIILIIVSIFGSIMTTLYFIKFLLAFQGTKSKCSPRVRDPSFTMWAPMNALSALCVVLGVFALSLSWRTITLPSVRALFPQEVIANPWTFGIAPFILVASILAGIVIYYFKSKTKVA